MDGRPGRGEARPTHEEHGPGSQDRLPAPPRVGTPFGSWQGTTLRRRNYSAVLRTILSRGPLSRAEVADLTGLTPATVTKITAVLLSRGLVQEEFDRDAPRERGRPRIPVAVAPEGFAVAGVHIGALRTTVGLVGPRGQVVAESVVEHATDDASTLIAEAASAVAEIVADNAIRPVLGIGASIGGWVDTAAGTVVDHASLHWQGICLAEGLERATGMPVVLNNNARAMAMAEAWFGAARHADTFLFLSVGNIVGGAFVVDRTIHEGPRSAAVRLDHLPVRVRTSSRCGCGRYDCLQAVASDQAVLEAARRSGVASRSETIERLMARATAGETDAGRILRTRARHVGNAVGLLADILNPELVVVGGGILANPQYLDDLRHAAAAHSHTALDAGHLVVPSELGAHSLALASGALLLDAYYRDPLAYRPLAH